MADANADFQAQMDAYIKQKRTELQGAINVANQNADVGRWGGSEADREHWLRVAGENQAALAQLNKGEGPLLELIKQKTIDPIQIGLAKQYLTGDPMAQQAADEMAISKKQIEESNAKLAQFRSQLESQYFGAPGLSLAEALSNPQGDIGQLGKFLEQQQSATFKQELAPLINMQMGSQGLIDSGANVELQAKALGQLERQRQSSLMEAALGARGQVQGLQREDVLGDIGMRQAALSGVFDLQRQSLTMNFQRQLEKERTDLARELSQNRGGSSMLNQILGGVGAAGSIALAPFTGGSSLLALPAFLGTALGEGGAGGIAAGTGAMGASFLSRSGGGQTARTGTVQGGREGGWQRYPSGRTY